MNKSKHNHTTIISVAIFLVFFAGFLYLMYANTIKEADIILNDEVLQVKGMFGYEYDISKITEIQLKDTLPTVTKQLGGAGIGNVKKGRYETVEMGILRMYVHDGTNPPFIYIFTEDESLIINYSDIEKTTQLYNRLISVIY